MLFIPISNLNRNIGSVPESDVKDGSVLGEVYLFPAEHCSRRLHAIFLLSRGRL